MSPAKRIGVLVIDDSAVNRRALTQILDSSPDVQVLGRANDGDDGLRLVAELQPDVITLDLQMPRLDGFSFLRLLMAKSPTPVIVISSFAQRRDVFRALELGAVDFIAKPSRADRGQLDEIRQELLEKVRAAKTARPSRNTLAKLPAVPNVVAIGASTGGPPAISQLLRALDSNAGQLAVLIAQHMPARFTAAFADRLDRAGAFTVTEAKDGDVVEAGHVYIAPGGRHLSLTSGSEGLALKVGAASSRDKHAPSVDRLFESVGAALGKRALGIVLTGMGADGAAGAKALKKSGGQVWAESSESAVIFGMPKEAIATGAVTQVLRLVEISPAIHSWMKAP